MNILDDAYGSIGIPMYIVSGDINAIFTTIKEAIEWVSYSVWSTENLKFTVVHPYINKSTLNTTRAQEVIHEMEYGNVYAYVKIESNYGICVVVGKLVSYYNYSL